MTVELSPVTTFTARLLPALARRGGNTVCSPLSAQVALTLVALGARGETRTELEHVLGAPTQELTGDVADLGARLAEIQDPATARLASGVWTAPSARPRPEYCSEVERELGAAVGELDPSDAAALDRSRARINAWVAERTAGRITELLNEQQLTTQTLMVLVSALHLRGPWPEPLRRDEAAFTLADGTTVTVPMLHGIAGGWYADKHASATALRTRGGALSLVLVRPTTGVDDVLAAWAADPSALENLLAGVREGQGGVQLAVPPLEVAWGADLTEPLRALGLERTLSPGADLTGMLEGPGGVGAVVQKAVLSLDEHGMEAAAATAAIALRGAPAPPRHELSLDVPFLLLACEGSTGLPLIAGRIEDPRA